MNSNFHANRRMKQSLLKLDFIWYNTIAAEMSNQLEVNGEVLNESANRCMMEILIGNKAEQLRKKYISCFVDTNLEYYLNRIKKCIKCSDGMCYTGYLWDCLKNKFVMPEDECLLYIKNTEDIYMFWDIHSKDRIFIPDYWKYPKEAVLKMNYKEFVENMDNFPEDIYVMDDTFEWSVAFTHETTIQQKRYCLFAYL